MNLVGTALVYAALAAMFLGAVSPRGHKKFLLQNLPRSSIVFAWESCAAQLSFFFLRWPASVRSGFQPAEKSRLNDTGPSRPGAAVSPLLPQIVVGGTR